MVCGVSGEGDDFSSAAETFIDRMAGRSSRARSANPRPGKGTNRMTITSMEEFCAGEETVHRLCHESKGSSMTRFPPEPAGHPLSKRGLVLRRRTPRWGDVLGSESGVVPRDVLGGGDGGDIGGYRWRVGEYRGIDDAQAVDAMHASLQVDHCRRIARQAHRRGGDWMVVGIERGLDRCEDRLVALGGGAGSDLAVDQIGQRRRPADLARQLRALEQAFAVLRGGEEVEINLGRDLRVAALDPDAAPRQR